LVKAANWLNHLEYDWQSPTWSELLHELAASHLLVRYDERGNGLSDWDVDEYRSKHSFAISKASSMRPASSGSHC
jgi:pimeloyl-ACP methyl ester carboxylesterase